MIAYRLTNLSVVLVEKAGNFRRDQGHGYADRIQSAGAQDHGAQRHVRRKKASLSHAALLSADWILAGEGQKVLAVALAKGVAMTGLPVNYKRVSTRPRRLCRLGVWQSAETLHVGVAENIGDGTPLQI